MRIRSEASGDAEPIRALVRGAFPDPAVADLVEKLRADDDIVFSLVAEKDGELAGHVLFSRMTAPFRALGLGPVATSARWRRQGVAARLIEIGLVQAAAAGWEAVFALGDPAYYRRFGFDLNAAAGFQSPYAGPYFMLRKLAADLPAAGGPVGYAPAFGALGC